MPDNIKYKGELQELIVSLKPWQRDFHTNFANHKLRKRFIDDAKEAYINYPYDLAIEENYDDYNLKNAIIERNKNRVSLKDADVTPIIQRLYNTWNIADRPKITDKPSIVNKVYPGRPNSNPVTNTLYNIGNLNDVIAELAHPIQNKYGKRNKVYHRISDIFQTISNELTGKRNHYDNPNHYEHETHSIIEPEIYDYIVKNISTNYVPINAHRSLED